ncbi:MAG: class I SAM-dependent methyltransferase [Gammaproteobacteria bacterium]|nr:class I SAM-dependent methyltransferase [Gammaproteobacteria bacterium]
MSVSESKTDAAGDRYLQERRRALRFFNGSSFLYPVVERRLEPEYRDALDELGLAAGATVLDLATGTGGLAGAFAARGHPVTGLDFAERLLARARRRFPEVEFRHFDLLHLDRLEAKSRDVVSMAYFLHGLSPEFRRFVLAEAARIAREHVLVFDYCCDGGLLVRLIEWVEGPNYPLFVAEDRERELLGAGLELERARRVSKFGGYWLCRPI